MTLQEIKDQVAAEWFTGNNVVGPDKQFWSFKTLPIHAKEECWSEVCRRAQLECARETLKEAGEKSLKDFISYIPGHFPTEFKASITDEANIKLIQ